MHGLLRRNINTSVHTRARGADVSLRDVTIAQMGNGLASANDLTHRKRAEDFVRFWKKSFSRVETCLGRRRLSFACSRRPWAVVARDVEGGGRLKSQNRENVYLSPYVDEPLKSKVIENFVPELRSRKCFSCFEIPMFYVIYICTLYVHFTHSCILL